MKYHYRSPKYAYLDDAADEAGRYTTLEPSSADDEAHRYTTPEPSSADRRPTASTWSCTGTIIAGNPPREIHVESLLERNVALSLCARPDVVGVREQVALQYVDDDGQARIHYLDFVVTKRDGSIVAVSVKAHDRAARAHALLARVMRQNASFADKFLVMTDRHLDRDAVDSAALVAESRRRDDPEADDLVNSLVGSSVGSTTIGSLVEASGLGARAFHAVVRALGDGKLVRSGGGRIGHGSIVRRAAN